MQQESRDTCIEYWWIRVWWETSGKPKGLAKGSQSECLSQRDEVPHVIKGTPPFLFASLD